MHRMRSRQIGFRLDLGPINHFMQARRARVTGRIDHVNIVRANPGQQQILPRHRAIVETRRAGVPTHMVQLITNSWHLQTVDHLRIGRTIGINIHRRQIIGFLNARTGINRYGIEQLFTRRLDGLLRACIARSTTVLHLRRSPMRHRALSVDQ